MKLAFVQKENYEKMGVHFLAGALKAQGHEVDQFIANLEDDIYAAVEEFNPDCILFSAYLSEELFLFEAFEELKKRLPETVSIVGGPFTLLFPEIVTKSYIDYVLRGDAEQTLIDLINLIHAKASEADIKAIDGVAFMDSSGQFFLNEKTSSIKQLQTIAPADRDLYYKYPTLSAQVKKDFIASRGCPYDCSFCYNTQLKGFFDTPYWRLRPPATVIEEIKYVRDTYGLEWVHFQDGTFNANKRWMKEFLTEYKNNNLPPYLCNVRVEYIDLETVEFMKETGCDRVTFGIQSGSHRIRRDIAGREMENELIVKAGNLFKQAGIRVSVDVIFGWPSETLKEALETIHLCREVDSDYFSSNVLRFYPKLSVTEYAETNGYIPRTPTLEDLNNYHANKSFLDAPNKKLLVNMDKLFYYMIRYPALEKLMVPLLYLPPNKFFYLMKNLHSVLRSMKYDTHRTKLDILRDYIRNSLKHVSNKKVVISATA